MKAPVSQDVGTRVLFEDKEVRLWTIELPPGEECEMHEHLLDYATVTLEGGHIQRINEDGSVDDWQRQAGDLRTKHIQGHETHALRNVGETTYRNVIVERIGPVERLPGSRDSNPIGTVVLHDDPYWRIWTIDLQPGEECGMHTHFLDYTTVVLEGDEVQRLNEDGSVDTLKVTPGHLMRRREGSVSHGLRNSGTHRFRNIIFEMK